MSTHAGPNIVESGLVLSLDSANEKSFRGVPTTNLSRQDSNFTGTAYGSGDQYGTPALIKTYDSTIKTPIGYGATLVTESGATDYHTLSSWGGGNESFLHSISCYIKPMSSITSFWIGMVNSTGKGVNFNLDTLSVNSESVTNNQYFIHAVDGYPGWIRIGANIEGRFGGWVGALGYSMLSYTGTAGGKPYYITGIQYEYLERATPFITSQGTRGATVATGGGLKDLSAAGSSISLNNLTIPFYGDTKSLVFNGTSNYITIPNPLGSFSTNFFNISMWIKPTVNQRSFFLTPQSAGVDHWLEYSTTAAIAVQVTESADVNNRNRSSTASSVPLNTWTHISINMNNLEIGIYINGKLNSSYTETIPVAPWTGDWLLGQRGNSTYWYGGEISSMNVYNRTLSSDEISDNFNATRGRYGI